MSFLASTDGRASGYGHFIQLTRLGGYWRVSRLTGEITYLARNNMIYNYYYVFISQYAFEKG